MLLLLLVVFTLFVLVDLAILAYWLLPDREPTQQAPVESPVRSGPPVPTVPAFRHVKSVVDGGELIRFPSLRRGYRTDDIQICRRPPVGR